ncbi:S8 family peptidase [Leptolyngbya sp. AN02str]|uniref:S8 family peptidase n=1 Tax=Leptolyngbya sp. AN02str TaxID=3423363 RepID=UPI003D321064
MSNLFPGPARQETTGRYLVLLTGEERNASLEAIANATGVRTFAHSADFGGGAPPLSQFSSDESLVLDELGVAVVSLDPQQVRSLMAIANQPQTHIIVEPERVVYAIQDPQKPPFLPTYLEPNSATDSITVSVEYLKGYRDAIDSLIHKLAPADANPDLVDGMSGSAFANTSVTWGLQATKANISRYSGLGIKVAVLDTGFDINHPDFVGRTVVGKSFIEGEEVNDGNGHGTHCIGTACGSLAPATLPRYGVAYNAEIYAGKVLSNEGSGGDGSILAGIDWAIANGCQVISMSLGSLALPGQPYSQIYEQVGRRSLDRGSLIIAAAGNDSWRQFGIIVPVSHPANCPSIMAVGALDSSLRIARFSNGGIKIGTGQIDLAAPGVDVYSSWPLPTRYQTISGTSMATPHVAGIAALYAEATGARSNTLWTQLIQNAQRLSLPSRDVGSGLAQAI